jgi:hypothetical protein
MATAIIYVISSGRFCKVGWTTDIQSRLRAFSTACPIAPELEHWRLVPRERAIDLERHVHAALDWHRSNGEWFRVSPAIAEKTVEASRRALGLPNLIFGKDRVIREAPEAA